MPERDTRGFIFCTSYMQPGSRNSPAERWQKWLHYYSQRRHLFGAERIFLIDDGTPLENITLPVAVVPLDRGLPEALPEGPVLLRFAEHLGRSSVSAFPGWWRSFSFAARVASKYGYGKVIHLESDAYVISRRLSEYVRDFSEGWAALWCPRHSFPETAIQIICGAHLWKLGTYYTAGPLFWLHASGANRIAEYLLPFTEVCTRFQGDRYSEFRWDYPETADYVCQAPLEMQFDHKLV